MVHQQTLVRNFVYNFNNWRSFIVECPHGSHIPGGCYYIEHGYKSPWGDAEATCNYFEKTLVKVDSSREETAINKELSEYHHTSEKISPIFRTDKCYHSFSQTYQPTLLSKVGLI